ncbi:MAG: hypothetical protein AB4041_09740 [Microcystaceae cyanobacterium]
MLLTQTPPITTDIPVTYPTYPLTQGQLTHKLTQYLGDFPDPNLLLILWNELIKSEKRSEWQDTVIFDRYEQLESYFPCF